MSAPAATRVAPGAPILQAVIATMTATIALHAHRLGRRPLAADLLAPAEYLGPLTTGCAGQPIRWLAGTGPLDVLVHVGADQVTGPTPTATVTPLAATVLGDLGWGWIALPALGRVRHHAGDLSLALARHAAEHAWLNHQETR